MKIVLIEWVDSHSSNRWRNLSEIEESFGLCPCVSVGFLLKESKDAISIVASISGDDNTVKCGTGDICIPRKAIIKMQVLQKSAGSAGRRKSKS